MPFQIDFYFLHLSHGSFFQISKLLGSLNGNQRFCQRSFPVQNNLYKNISVFFSVVSQNLNMTRAWNRLKHL